MRRRLGQTDLEVTPVAMGCWPIAGITSIDVTEAHGLATLRAALEAGLNFFDTAYCYGYDGESERMVGRSLGPHRDDVVIASKCGVHWEHGQQVKDGRPETIRRECEESLQRLGTDRIDLYYLHSPDPSVPVADSAGAFNALMDEGLVRAVGVSNFRSVDLIREFHAVCPVSAVQLPYNMLQREIETDLLPWCRQNDIAVVVYWPLMKGFLAGRLQRDHQWDPQDRRQEYPIFRGAEWEKTHDLLDRLRELAAEIGCTVAQLVVAWTIQQPGITAALCGAKRPEQIRETAAAMQVPLDAATMHQIARAIAERGDVIT